VKNYILCSRCNCRIRKGEKFNLIEIVGGSPDNPYCLGCAGTFQELDDEYIDEFWNGEHADWAEEHDECEHDNTVPADNDDWEHCLDCNALLDGNGNVLGDYDNYDEIKFSKSEN